MTPHEKFINCMHFKSVDRHILWEWGPWLSTLRRWQREAPGEFDSIPPQLLECENRVLCGVDLWMLPRFEKEILSENEEFITKRNDRGIVERVPKSQDETSMPEHIDFPVKEKKDWERLKKCFDPNDSARFPADWENRCDLWRKDGPVLVFQGPRSPSLFGFIRELMGPERALYAFYDDPMIVHDMMDTYTDFIVQILPRVISESPLSSVFFWEDMCYKSGSFISPDLFKRFMSPCYKRITEMVRNMGIDIIFVDSDGDVSELIPLWLEVGINGVYPMEVAAGMDVIALRNKYGKDLLMTGGIDKRILSRDYKAIDEELERKIPLVELGGYIPTLDHSVPDDVPYRNFCYYWSKKKELLGIR